VTELAETSASVHWDGVWRETGGGPDWSTPEQWVLGTIPAIRERGGTRVLDLGCGVGRHSLAFAAEGFTVHAVDRSPAGIDRLQEEASGRKLTVHTALTDFTELPYDDGTMDYVLAWNVVYHGTPETVGRALTEVTRVLRPEGLYQSTMLSKRNAEFGRGDEIAPGAFVQPDGPDDKAYPHLYCDAADLLRLHEGLDLRGAFDAEHQKPGSFHWHLLWEKRGSA
jgi:tellurite methyltransferase